MRENNFTTIKHNYIDSVKLIESYDVAFDSKDW